MTASRAAARRRPAFVEPLFVPPILPEVPLSTLNPAPTNLPNTAINPATGLPFEGRTLQHQFRASYPPAKYFTTTAAAGAWSFSSALPTQTIWGFDTPSGGPTFPGPTLVSQYGQPILVRRHNGLPPVSQNGGFGLPSISTHLHNFHTGSESDGNPCMYFERGQYYDYHYTMARAGFDSTHPGAGDPRETLGSLWYHDHRIDNTAANVYKGMAGFHLMFDDVDTGDEGSGLHLPSFPDYDIPLFLTDKLFDPGTGQLCFDLFGFDGLVGDKFAVNGKLQPFFDVSRRRYRFRILDGGPSRFYELYLTDPNHPNTPIPFWIIGNDGNLLPRPIQATSVRLSVAERVDIIVDFDNLPNNPSVLYLENRLEQDDGRGPDEEILPPTQGDYLMEFRIGAPVADGSVDPATLPPLRALPSKTAPPRVTRTFKFDRRNGQWAINGRFASCEQTRFRVKRNSVEHWILRNSSGGWQHPIHIHLEEFQIIRRNGVAPPANSFEDSRKDVLRLGFNEEVEVFFRFRDFRGVYPMHCHNTIHEDHAMMLLFDIDDTGDMKAEP